jgi:N-acetylglutamate synthase-like GNAT family acetyltransferase
MPEETIDQKLRQMAEHRGFKLVKSRKRKPGTGDFGKFGLTQADGKPLLGMGGDGLTASADDIEAYLRNGSVSTWKASAESASASVVPAEKPKRGVRANDDIEGPSVIRPRGRHAGARNAKAKQAATESRTAQPADEAKPRAKRVSRMSTGRRSAPPEAKPYARVTAEPEPAPVPAPQLHVRAAKPADAAALAKLLAQLAHVEIDELGIARNLEAVRKAKGGMVVAELGGLVGCCTWALIPTIQHGLIGRVTMILVDEDHRRRGIAKALFETVLASLSTAGCTRVEAMSAIEIRNAHGFFRALKFEQTSYRFARVITVDS